MYVRQIAIQTSALLVPDLKPLEVKIPVENFKNINRQVAIKFWQN
jgi:hypothetical protein